MIPQIFKRCCGLDVHKESITATLIKGSRNKKERKQTKKFATYKQDLLKLKEWLVKEGCEAACMESTGVLWFNLYDILQPELKVVVANAKNVKNVPGRKTDVLDSEWLAELLRCGLLKGSFIPCMQLRNLRMLTRYRLAIIKQFQAQKNRITKVLETAGIKLGCVASDIFGSSGSLIIKDLIEGKMHLQEIAEKRGKRLKAGTPEIANAIDGNLDDEKTDLLSDMIEYLQLIENRIANLERKILSKIEPYRTQWQLAQTIPGIDEISAASVIAEIGTDMKQFHNDRHQLSSWAGICPGNNESAGKKKSAKIRKGSRALRRILCQIANAACKCKGTQFEHFYKSLLIRRGHKRAIVALAHKILRVIFSVFINNKPYYEPKANYEELMTKRNAPRWIKALKKYGYIPQEAKKTQA